MAEPPGEGEEEARPTRCSLRSSERLPPTGRRGQRETQGPGALHRGRPPPHSPPRRSRPPPCPPPPGVISGRVRRGRRAPGRVWWAGPCGGRGASVASRRAGWSAGPTSGPPGAEARAGESSGAERRVAPCGAPRAQAAAAAAPADCGWADGRAGTRASRGAGRGGAAPSPGQQRPPHKGGGATGRRGPRWGGEARVGVGERLHSLRGPRRSPLRGWEVGSEGVLGCGSLAPALPFALPCSLAKRGAKHHRQSHFS